MSEPFLSEMRMFGFNFPPRGWALCDGQILPINQNQSLYSLLGTTYGGDGRTSFALPDMRSRLPAHVGNGLQLGQKTGRESIGASNSTQVTELVVDRSLATTNSNTSVANNGVGIKAPYTVVNFAIALQGLFPSRN